MKLMPITLLAVTLGLFACSSQPTKTATTAAPSDAELADALAAVFGEQLKPDMAKVEQHPLGSLKNPVRVAMPMGERDYVARLICANGEQVSAYARDGSAGIGPYGSMLDAYTVICDTNEGAVEHTVYMDMYHADHEETRPAHGFKALTPPKK